MILNFGNFAGHAGKSTLRLMADSPQSSASFHGGAKIALRFVGAINALAALGGMYFEFDSARFCLFKYTDPFAPPAFKTVFVAMMLINLAFDGILLFTAIRFLQARMAGAKLYSLTVLSLVVYGIVNGLMWRIGGDVGTSIAALTGVGNMGIAPFDFLFVVPDLYPLASAMLVLVLKRSTHVQVPATA